MQKLLIVVIALGFAAGLPVSQKKASTEKPDKPAEPEAALENVLEYERYLKEVVEALESDPEFRKKLDKAPEADIRSGKIAQELEYVSHHIRSKLDEIKRREIDRLRAFANRQFELSNDIDRDHLKIGEHVHHDNLHTFEIEDLRKLILKTSQDLAEADQKRREEFKQYEMQKEFEQQQKIHDLDDEHRKKYEEELKEKKKKHNKHAKVHHPGNKAQLEEVWEKQDHMEGQDFDPRAFFTIHDVDGNGYWDETELKALFIKELDKVYQEGLPEDDLRERTEEMERMREHVFRESDTNRDGLISFQEFIDQTKREEFNRDPSWETVDNMPQYTHEEYLEFEKKRQEEVQRLIAQGTLQAHPNMPQGYYPNGQPNPNQKEMHYQQQPQYHQQQQLHQQQQQQQHYQQQQQQQYQQQQQQYEQHHQQQYNQQQQYQPVQQQAAQNQQQPPPQQQQPPPQQQQQYQQQPSQQQQQYQQPPAQQQQQYQQPPSQQQQQQYQQPPVQQPNQPVPVQQQQPNQPVPVQQQPPPVQQQQQNQPPPVQQQNQPLPVQQQNQPPPVQQQQQNQPPPVQPQQVPNQQYVQQQKPIQTGANVPNANALPSDGQKQDVKHH